MVSQPELPFRTIDIRNREGAAALADPAGRASATARPPILTGPQILITARDRAAGFADAFAEHGHPIDDRWLVDGEFTRDGGFLGAAELQRRGLGGVEVIFAVNDIMAVGAIAYLRSAGVRLPEDVAVAGFDDISEPARHHPGPDHRVPAARADRPAGGRAGPRRHRRRRAPDHHRRLGRPSGEHPPGRGYRDDQPVLEPGSGPAPGLADQDVRSRPAADVDGRPGGVEGEDRPGPSRSAGRCPRPSRRPPRGSRRRPARRPPGGRWPGTLAGPAPRSRPCRPGGGRANGRH